MVAEGEYSLSQTGDIATDKLSSWDYLDAEFNSIITPVHSRLCQDDLKPAEAAFIFSSLLKAHLVRFEKLPEGQGKSQLLHRTRRIERTTESLRRTKNTLRNQRKTSPKNFFNVVRAHNKCLKSKRILHNKRATRSQERDFKENPWHFAIKICMGNKSGESPSFDASVALNYFQDCSSASDQYHCLPSWVEDVMPQTMDVPCPFDLSPFTPGDIKRTLKKRPSKSTPGEDGITYHFLKKLPSTHHFLATLFSKILLVEQQAPESWCSALIKLIHKAGDTTDPGNFRPIALTSVVGKLFHKLMATRLEHYLRDNNIINTTTQKGFLTGINGTMEHMFAMSSLLENALKHGLPLAVTFLDLKNAFGSVPHGLIYDMLAHINLPTEVINYVRSSHSKLKCTISTKEWSTTPFQIDRGVFQGDTLSPLIFLIAFNPIIELAESLHTLGFHASLPNHPSHSLPDVNQYIYALWDEKDSEEPRGWYLAKIMTICPSGSVTLYYRKSKSHESINLNNLQWLPARGNGKWFLPPESLSTASKSKPHKVKGFADDLTVLSRTTKDHQDSLLKISTCCKDLDLTLKPSKCVSLVLTGKKVNKKMTFSVGAGRTRNISSGAFKFLGQTICHSTRMSSQEASKKIEFVFGTQLQNLDKASIRGEYKLWIYKRYLATSFHFALAVDNIYETTLKNMQKAAMRKIKRWLNIPKSCSTAVIHHPGVIDIPTLSELRTKAKLTLLSAISTSKDPLIVELQSLSLSSTAGTPAKLLSLAKDSVSQITTKTLNNQCRKEFASYRLKTWNENLQKLVVQNKFLEAADLEAENRVWNRIQSGLPAGQLSFILRASSDTLPTPLNMKRWKMRIDPKCALCGSRNATVHHILSHCPTALQQGRYTWRHDSALQSIANDLQKFLPTGAKLWVDLPGRKASDNPPATMPAEILETSARPDIVVLLEKKITLLELTIPHNAGDSLDNARYRKRNKENYQHALSDLELRGYTSNLITIEIGTLGHWQKITKSELLRELNFIDTCKSDFSNLLDRSAKKAISTSRQIFNARNDATWLPDRPLL